MKKRILSLALAVALALSLTPAAMAYDGPAARSHQPSPAGIQAPALTESSPAATGWTEWIPYQGQASAPGELHLYGATVDEEQVYQILNGLRSQYPEGMYWTNESQRYTLSVPVYDESKGMSYTSIGYGCVAFCFRLSDAAFGSMSARKVSRFTYDDIHVGDILRVNGDTHSVIVLQKFSDYVVLAEGNYNSSVHWDRTMTRNEVMRSNYIITRYPSGTPSGTPSGNPSNVPSNVKVSTDKTSYSLGETVTITYSASNAVSYNLSVWLGDYGTGTLVTSENGFTTGKATWQPNKEGTYTMYVEAINSYGFSSAACQFVVSDGLFTDVPSYVYYADAVEWAYNNKITDGTGGRKFSPDSTVTRGQAVTFLWRAMNRPSPSSLNNPFTDVSPSAYYYEAMLWAVENGITNGVGNSRFNPDGSVTRGQMVTFLWRAMDRPGETGQGDWYTDAEYWANSNSLLSGTAERYTTSAVCPRSDVVYYLWNALA